MDWARDRATLWNSVERTSLRNALLGREVMVVLPGELSAAQRSQLARRFGQELADRYLGAVDVTVHPPRSGSVDVGHHAHILMTPRRVTPEGIGARTILELSGTELYSRGLGPYKREFLLIRERWAAVTNDALRDAGLDLRVDHRSFKAQGIDREPVFMLPRNLFRMEQRHGASRAGDRLRAEYRERVEARAKGPDELARVLQKQKEEARRRTIEWVQRKALSPKKMARAALTKEELLRMRREMYHSNEARRLKILAGQREYRRANAEMVNQRDRDRRFRAKQSRLREKELELARGREKQEQALGARARQELEQRNREASLRAKPSPEREAAQRWWQSRQKEKELEKAGGRQVTAEDSARNWLALRERQKQAELSPGATKGRTHERSFGKSLDHDDDEALERRKQLERNRDYDYEL
jgi:MobA/MobL family